MTDSASAVVLPLLAVFGPGLAAGAAAAAVAVPLLVHLLFRKRYQIVPFAAVRFLLAAERRSRRRVDHWLLLALRSLALLLPLFALIAATDWAEPLWQAIRPGPMDSVLTTPRTHHVLVLDGSLSMTARTDDGRTRFERARGLAEDLIRNGRPGDGYTVVFLAGSVQTVVPGPSNAPEKVLAELSKLKPTHAAADTAAALPVVADALARSPRSYPRRQVTFLTDLQRSAWVNALPRSDAATPEAWAKILHGRDGTGTADVVVVDAAQADRDNLAVADLTLADPLPLVNTPAVVTATVQNHGRAERQQVRVELLLGRPPPTTPSDDSRNGAMISAADALVALETRTIDAIPAGGRASVSFTLEGPRSGLHSPGIHVIQARLVEGDDLPADDTRTLAVEVRDGLHVLIVDGKKGERDPLRRAGEYLSRALVPPGAKPADTPARLFRPGARWPDHPDERWILSASEFARPDFGDPTGADCIFLCDLPTLTPGMVSKLETHLKRGGGIVIGFGPNAVTARATYNRLLYDDGNGLLPGSLGEAVTSAPDTPGFRLTADEDAARKPPLIPFREDAARASLVTVPFRDYGKLDAPPDGRARRVLSFVPAGSPMNSGDTTKPDPAVIEWLRHRGRVVVYTSSFNRDWTDWPVLPSYLPFVHELLRFAAASPDRHTIRVGDAIEEFFPPSAAGLTAGLTAPDGSSVSLPIVLRDEAAVVRFTETSVSGLYRLGIGAARDRIFAVNPPETGPGGSEFDLRRVEPSDFQAVGPVQVVAALNEVKPTVDGDGITVVSAPRPHGPTIARWALLLALAVLVAEVVLAWRVGPGRTAGVGTVRAPGRHPLLRLAGNAAVVSLIAGTLALVAVGVRAEFTGDALGFLPDHWKAVAEANVAQLAGVAAAPSGESNQFVLERVATMAHGATLDRLLVGGLAVGFFAFTLAVYARERQVAGGMARLLLPGAVRGTAFVFVLLVLLPQWQLAFKRKGWPEVVILLDTSASMATADDIKDAAVRAKAEELTGAAGLPLVHRLKLAQLLLTRSDAGWVDRLLRDKQVQVHVYAMDEHARLVATAAEERDAAGVRDAILALQPEGEASRLGEGVGAVVKAYQGGSLAGVIVFTDGVTTAGPDLPDAARSANVPLYLIGLGDPWVTPDLRLSDPVFEDVLPRGDTLDIQVRLSSRGAVPPDPVPIVLSEKVNGRLVERGRATAVPGEKGRTVRIPYTPTELGEKTLVLEVPTVPGEADTANNRIEWRVLVTESRPVRVLFVEGDPRYDYRFAKVLLERESDRIAGNKTIELKTVLLGASRGWAETDKSALPDFPTRDQLFTYDVVILGDIDPKQLPRSSRALQDVADFVTEKGGGLLLLAGEHYGPAAFADTPLADVLPVVSVEPSGTRPATGDPTITDSYRPALTRTGRAHPLFAFHPDPAESDRIWNQLQPLFWFARGYHRKPAAEVLAVHPDRLAEGTSGRENHPLVLQQFVGAGRVLFLGFDETWRWRFRADEVHFNRFWLQAVRVLARTRRGRVELRLRDGSGPYRQDDRITVAVRFPDDAPTPPPGTVVRVRVTRTPLPGRDGANTPGNAETQEFMLNRVETERAEFRAVLTRTPTGRYSFTLTDPETPTGNPPHVEASVLPPPTERERLDMDRVALSVAAATSHGRFYTLADADEVFTDLGDPEPVALGDLRPPLPLWNHPAAFGVLLALLGAEWLLRKRERLV